MTTFIIILYAIFQNIIILYFDYLSIRCITNVEERKKYIKKMIKKFFKELFIEFIFIILFSFVGIFAVIFGKFTLYAKSIIQYIFSSGVNLLKKKDVKNVMFKKELKYLLSKQNYNEPYIINKQLKYFFNVSNNQIRCLKEILYLSNTKSKNNSLKMLNESESIDNKNLNSILFSLEIVYQNKNIIKLNIVNLVDNKIYGFINVDKVKFKKIYLESRFIKKIKIYTIKEIIKIKSKVHKMITKYFKTTSILFSSFFDFVINYYNQNNTMNL
jgi:hypothetical protein